MIPRFVVGCAALHPPCKTLLEPEAEPMSRWTRPKESSPREPGRREDGATQPDASTSPATPASSLLSRSTRLILAGVAGALGGAVLMLLPDLLKATPFEIWA